MTITPPCHTMTRKQAQSKKVRLFQGSRILRKHPFLLALRRWERL